MNMTFLDLKSWAAPMVRSILGVSSPANKQEDLELQANVPNKGTRLDFDDLTWPRQHHRNNIIHKIKSPTQNLYSYRIYLTELQQLHLRQLQRKLLEHAVDLRHGAREPPGWADDLRQYVQALQDFDYMQKFIRLPTDPFVITGERILDRYMLNAALKGLESRHDSQEPLISTRKWEDGSEAISPIAGTRDQNLKTSRFKAFRERLALAALGAIFLIAPMWLMVLHNTLYTTLVSTTVFIIVFGFLMAVSLSNPMDVMASTAAYAAVLVVFVGLNVDSG